MDRIKEQKEIEYKKLWTKADEARMDAYRKLDRIGFDDDFISCIGYRAPRISEVYTDENTDSGCVNVMVKFSLEEDKWNKLQEKRKNSFKV